MIRQWKDVTGRITDNRLGLSLALTSTALLLWAHSILFARLDINDWGLIHGLPLSFFLALALLSVAAVLLWTDRQRHYWLPLLQLVIIVVALDSIPQITGGSNQFINHSYRNVGYVDYIVRTHSFSGLVNYLSWPGAFVMAAEISQICSVDFTPLIERFSFLLPLFTIPLAYIFFKNVLPATRSNLYWAACWLYFLASWGSGNLITAGGYAIFLTILLLVIATMPSLRQSGQRYLPILLLMAMVFAAVTVTHLLTSLAVICMLGAIAIVRLDKRLMLTISCTLVILLCWNLSEAGDYIISRLPLSNDYGLIQTTETASEPSPMTELPETTTPLSTEPSPDEPEPAVTPTPTEPTPTATTTPELFTKPGMIILDPEVLMEREITSHLSGSESHRNVVIVRMIYAGIFALLGLSGVIYAAKTSKERRTAFAIFMMTAAPMVLVTLSGHYAREILGRIYSFLLPGAAYFSAHLFGMKNRISIIILSFIIIIVLPLNVIAASGNAELDYFSPEERSATFFFHEVTSGGVVFGGWPVGALANVENYYSTNLAEITWQEDNAVSWRWFDPSVPHYVAVSRHSDARYGWFEGDTGLVDNIVARLASSTANQLIYYNHNLKLYFCRYVQNDGG